jgi:hypothetical protein
MDTLHRVVHDVLLGMLVLTMCVMAGKTDE